MKIFSNFDTRLRRKKHQEYLSEYGPENVLCITRSRLYRWIKVLIPTVVVLVVSILFLVLSYTWFGPSPFVYILIAIIIMDMVLAFPILGKLIDYMCDFIIVIPNCMIMYDQGGIFRRNTITISAQSIKTISIRKTGLLYSIFNNGDIIVLTEGDIQYGEVTLRRLPRPEKRRNQIARIIGIDLEANQNPH